MQFVYFGVYYCTQTVYCRRWLRMTRMEASVLRIILSQAVLSRDEGENSDQITNDSLYPACAVQFPSIRRQLGSIMLKRIVIAVVWKIHESR